MLFWKKSEEWTISIKITRQKRTRGLCRKTGFLHSNNSSFVPSCEWIYLLKVNLKTSLELPLKL